MILAIDVGNTNIVLGIYKGKKLLNYWRVKTDAQKTSDEYGMIINQLLSFKDLSFKILRKWCFVLLCPLLCIL